MRTYIDIFRNKNQKELERLESLFNEELRETAIKPNRISLKSDNYEPFSESRQILEENIKKRFDKDLLLKKYNFNIQLDISARHLKISCPGFVFDYSILKNEYNHIVMNDFLFRDKDKQFDYIFTENFFRLSKKEELSTNCYDIFEYYYKYDVYGFDFYLAGYEDFKQFAKDETKAFMKFFLENKDVSKECFYFFQLKHDIILESIHPDIADAKINIHTLSLDKYIN